MVIYLIEFCILFGLEGIIGILWEFGSGTDWERIHASVSGGVMPLWFLLTDFLLMYFFVLSAFYFSKAFAY